MKNVSTMTVGIDIGDRYSQVCILDGDGEIVEESRIRTTAQAFDRKFATLKPTRMALEVGTHSPWISRKLQSLGHDVIVANPRAVRLIYQNTRKNDRVDAEMLARLARVDPKLLKPVTHRDEQAQAALAVLHSRDALVRVRTALVNHVRGTVKSMGGRIRGCSTASLHKQAREQLPEALRETLEPMLDQIGAITQQIRAYDRRIETIAQEQYPQTKALRQIRGVGALTALTFVLILQDPGRFGRSRQVGAYLGLIPGQDQTGAADPQRRITKTGDPFLRRLLVHAAHYILGPFGQDSDLRRHGERIALRGGQNAKKRAVVAVARKLAVLMHRLWVTQADYVPLRNQPPAAVPACPPLAS